MKTPSIIFIAAAWLTISLTPLRAYERLQGPTEVLYWDKTQTYAGCTFFGAHTNTYLIDMEGRVVHTWPVGTNPRLLDNGNVLDASGGDVNAFSEFKEVDWNGNAVWQYTESRTNYRPHHDFLRIYNQQLDANTTIYIAAKSVTSNQCVAAGCNPANGPYTNAQVDAIVEVDMSGNVVWEWCFFDHGIQDFDTGKSNYVGVGKTIASYPGRLNLNLPGRPVTNDWLHCNSIDYNTNLDQIVINANYGAGNTNGMEFKQGTTNLADSTITTTGTIDARGSAGWVEFELWADGLSDSAGWTFQLDSGVGYITRLSELTGTSHNWQLYHYDLQPEERVSSLKMRFQFRGGQSNHRIDMDQISVKVVSGGTRFTNVTMLDDGSHHDGQAGDSTYGALIPALQIGTTVSYYLVAADAVGLSVTNPVEAPNYTFSYLVQAGATNQPPVAATNQTIGLFLNTTNAWPGYTLMAPMHSTNTYLINNAGEVVHMWTSDCEPGRTAYLLTNGHLIRACMVMGGLSTGGGEGGRIEEYDWDGNMVWAFDYYSSTNMAHHDFKVLPNGNVLVLAVEKKTYAQVIAAGFNSSLLDTNIAVQGMLPDYLIEVMPTRPYGGTIVWQWHLWDHMIQDFDPAKNNYGVVSDHPELIDVNGPGILIPQFWNHVNGIDHNPQLDQVILSIRGNSELFVIDHQTTTAQAATHAGGRYNKGGDILYRWGNPQQYNRGTSASQMLFQQHHTHWIDTNCPGAGHILIFNNGIGRSYSTINEIVPPVDDAGNYSLAAGAAYGPSTNCWTYMGSPATNFYSAEISGCQRLPNGNTLICEGVKGNLFEVTPACQTVWRYVCPVTDVGSLTQGGTIPEDGAHSDQFMNAVFRIYRYGSDYAGLTGRDLTPHGNIELPVDQTLRIVAATATPSGLKLKWQSLPNRNYVVLYKPALDASPWSGIATNHSIGTLTSFMETNSMRLMQSEGFYRIILSP